MSAGKQLGTTLDEDFRLQECCVQRRTDVLLGHAANGGGQEPLRLTSGGMA
jgi:hypothetical protein